MIDQDQPPMADQDAARTTELREVIIEFGHHLDTLAEQLGASMLEANRECVSVGESFHELAAAKSTIDEVSCVEPEMTTVLRSSCKQIGDSLHAAVVALQYQDRLAQRLSLVRAGLVRLQTLLHDQSARSYADWLQSLRDLERVNRVEQQRLGPEPADGPPGTQLSDVTQSSVELF